MNRVKLHGRFGTESGRWVCDRVLIIPTLVVETSSRINGAVVQVVVAVGVGRRMILCNQAVVVEQPELEGRSLSDSDLQIRWDIAIKEAEKVVEMGVKLGVQFIGPMEEVIREIAKLEMKESGLKEK
ncbi:hypothetical protein V6N13_023820 [Hibiscus sabdariffa]